MSDESLDFQRKDRAEKAITRVYRLLDEGVDAVGGIIPAAGICGTDRGDLRRALNRNGYKVSVDHLILLGERIACANYGLATKLGAAVVDAMDLQVFPRVTLSDKERADRCELALKMLGPLGEQALAQALGQEPVALGVRR